MSRALLRLRVFFEALGMALEIWAYRLRVRLRLFLRDYWMDLVSFGSVLLLLLLAIYLGGAQ
jgi:hypothetical protein